MLDGLEAVESLLVLVLEGLLKEELELSSPHVVVTIEPFSVVPPQG